ncbi:MAG: ComF family protein [Mariprofundaceae bacterium]
MDGESEGCCASCLPHIKPMILECCSLCGVAMNKAMAPGPCGKCLCHAPAQVFTSSLFEYHGGVREALLEWKLQGHDAAVVWLLHAALPRLQELIAPDDLLVAVPMPLSRMRLKARHHGADLCRMLATELSCQWEWRLLQRVGEQARQSSLSGPERKRNLCKAFRLDADYWQQCADIKGKVWLVDDIITTGSTARYAAKALAATGHDVSVLSLARSVTK